MQTGKRVMQDRKGRRERDPKQARIWFKEAEETYRDLRKASEAQGIFTMSGNYIQQELTMRRLQLPFWSTQRFTSWVVDLFCGYGEAPMRVVLFSLLLIFICSIFYFFCGLHFQGEHLIYQPGAPLEAKCHLPARMPLLQRGHLHHIGVRRLHSGRPLQDLRRL